MANDELLAAIEKGDQEEAIALLERDPRLCTAKDDPSALMHALYHRQTEVAHRIADRHQSLTPFEAAALGALEPLRSAIAADPLWTSRYAGDGFSALHLACFFGHLDAAKYLIAAGADPNDEARNPSRIRPLHSAVAAQSIPICTTLLQAGADPDARQHQGFTALHAAALHGYRELVDLLLEHGARRSITANDGRSAEEFARSGGYVDLADHLAQSRSSEDS